MSDAVPNQPNRKKADAVADAINRLLQNLVIRCAKEEGVRDYFYVGVIGYGNSVGPAFSGPLAGKDFVSISEVGNMPARIEDRTKKMDDGAGGISEQSIRMPIWKSGTDGTFSDNLSVMARLAGGASSPPVLGGWRRHSMSNVVIEIQSQK